MELLSVIAAFLVVVSLMSVPCASDQVNARKSLGEYGHYEVQQAQIVLLPLLARKLKLQEAAAVVIKSSSEKEIMAHKKLMETAAGGKHDKKEENVMQTAKGTWREWSEAPNKSEYFTMDYHWVRRRRPIHNKGAPLLP